SYNSRSGPDFSAETYAAIQADIAALLVDSQDVFPADFGNYGGLMIRLAWHCSGTYRQSDGRGGCDGGRIRFNPERSWADNTNLDKALNLLQPLKLKYGDAVSWGDLIVITGNVAIETMGGPIIGFCAGRQDDDSGFASLELGPTPEQEAVAPCAVNGTCELPLGTSTVGLIYVNAEGVLGVPEPENSVDDIRDVFSRMGMNDTETVALIGGGHSFGKTHGACDTGAGADPMDDPAHPWQGTCGTPNTPGFGVGNNTFTSGFEGPWTVEPVVWNNEYFKNLLAYDWEKEVGPGGHFQWMPVSRSNSTEDDDGVPDIMMLTADIALLNDATYLEIVTEFAENQYSLDVAFSNAWYKLTSRDMGPVTRCRGSDVPPAQEFQLPLPEPSVSNVEPEVEDDAVATDMFNGEPSYAALFVTLAFQCMDSFRSTDYLGGCNGARIRFSPQKDWTVNEGLMDVLSLLEPVKTKYPEVTYADLIQLAGSTALTRGGAVGLKLCPGRVDATEGSDLISVLEPRNYTDVIVGVRDRMKISGLSTRQMVALAGRPRSPSQMVLQGLSGSYSNDTETVSNEFYNILLTESWEEVRLLART
ncbi:unnamed protein product, partial [Sphacelaria rigidula]